MIAYTKNYPLLSLPKNSNTASIKDDNHNQFGRQVYLKSAKWYLIQYYVFSQGGSLPREISEHHGQCQRCHGARKCKYWISQQKKNFVVNISISENLKWGSFVLETKSYYLNFYQAGGSCDKYEW